MQLDSVYSFLSQLIYYLEGESIFSMTKDCWQCFWQGHITEGDESLLWEITYSMFRFFLFLQELKYCANKFYMFTKEVDSALLLCLNKGNHMTVGMILLASRSPPAQAAK